MDLPSPVYVALHLQHVSSGTRPLCRCSTYQLPPFFLITTLKFALTALQTRVIVLLVSSEKADSTCRSANVVQ